MKNLVLLLPLIWCFVYADSSNNQDVKQKTATATLNTIPPTPKQELYYQQVMKAHQPQQQLRPQLIPIQIIARPYYVHPSQIQQQQQSFHPQQPHAMIIIAQPALVPSSLVYGSAMQQLLNYFHNNPQAKYQLLHGGYQQPQAHPQPQQLQPVVAQQVQPTYVHQVLTAAPSYGNYIVAPANHHQYHQQTSNFVHTSAPPSAPAPRFVQTTSLQRPQIVAQYTNHQQQQQPSQLRSIAHLAQLAAQQYASSPMKQTPAIVTGFEHFTPEQQAQIKVQLNSHLGENYHAVSANAPSAASNTAGQYSAKYNANAGDKENNNFVPSPQLKNDLSTASIMSSGSDMSGELKTQYKG